MATPTTNSVPVTTFSPSSTGEGRYLAYGTKWGGGLGTGVQLTYSFPQGTATFITGYSEFSSWYQTTAAEQAAIRQGLNLWSSVARISFVQFPDNGSTVGELRFALTSAMSDFAHAYFPGSTPQAGDVWFRQGQWNTDRSTVSFGQYDHETIIHEIGHAIGLKHPFESPNVLSQTYDNMFYTVMSYTASPWSPHGNNQASFYPTTPMYYDLVAIQAIYGRNPYHHSGNTTYTFNDGSTYFQTIDDAGGSDLIIFNGTQSCRIDLRIGSYCDVSEAITFSGGTASRSTVWIGPGTVLEKATGGMGGDVLIGNASANVLNGRGGRDGLNGFAGNDVLAGGNGRDVMTGGSGMDNFNFNAASDTGNAPATRDVIRDFQHLADNINVHPMDASSILAGNNNFVFRGTGPITGSAAGELRYQKFNLAGTANDYTVIYGDTDGDAAPEFQIQLSGLVTLTAADFIL